MNILYTSMRIPGNGLLLFGLSIIGSLIIGTMTVPWLSPYGPTAMDLLHRLETPSAMYPLGTDQLGRSLLDRVLYGARATLLWSILATTMIVITGSSLGLIAAFGGRFVDMVIMRFVDIMLAFPSLVLVLAVVGFSGPSLEAAISGLVAGWAPSYARLVRGMVLSAREKTFVKASMLLGVPTHRLIWRHVLPQITPTILILASIEVGWIILALAGLGFLGIGLQPPTPEWGSMLGEARFYAFTAPHLMIIPGIAVAAAVLGFNAIGEGLRDLLDIRESVK